MEKAYFKYYLGTRLNKLEARMLLKGACLI